MPQCKNCQSDFTITDADRQFYNKMDVPEPVFCQICRIQQLMSWRNERLLYPNVCQLCQKPTLSLYNVNSPYKIYCAKCWWGDKWEALDYARDYDFSRSFFEQYGELLKAVPAVSLQLNEVINTEYGNDCDKMKDCYLVFNAEQCENCHYSDAILMSNDCLDCFWCLYCELCYDCLKLQQCYGCISCDYSENLYSCIFCKNCRDLKNCYGCVNLNHKEYCIFNKQYQEEEYLTKIKELGFDKIEFEKFYLSQPHKNLHLVACENCSGDNMGNCKNCSYCFDMINSNNCRNVWDGIINDSIDCFNAGMDVDGYMLSCCYRVNHCKFCFKTSNSYNCEYCQFCYNSHDNFGCYGLRNKNFCIFNKQYEEEEYKKIVEKIKKQMIKNNEYGKFFPISMSPFGYNETMAYLYLPISKERAHELGWKWQDNLPGIMGKETVKTLPKLSEISDDFVNEILLCEKCQRNYRLILPEIKFYRQFNLPLPRFCPECRFEQIFNRRNPRTLHHRQCMCEQAEHGHAARCENEFETTYAPDRPERVYCEDCYRKEIY